MAVMAAQRTREISTSAHGLGARVDVHQSLLFLSLGCGNAEWGGAFWKTNAYAPFPIWIWLNGHEWAKRQLGKAGIGYEALDNGFRSCVDPAGLQKICDSLSPHQVREFFWR